MPWAVPALRHNRCWLEARVGDPMPQATGTHCQEWCVTAAVAAAAHPHSTRPLLHQLLAIPALLALLLLLAHTWAAVPLLRSTREADAARLIP